MIDFYRAVEQRDQRIKTTTWIARVDLLLPPVTVQMAAENLFKDHWTFWFFLYLFA